eukprot:6971379-Prymnesium_polylepis.1
MYLPPQEYQPKPQPPEEYHPDQPPLTLPHTPSHSPKLGAKNHPPRTVRMLGNPSRWLACVLVPSVC